MSYPFPQIGIVGGREYANEAEFDRIFRKIIAILEPVVVHVLDCPLAIRWLSSYAAISYKYWNQQPTLEEFAKPLHGILIIHEDGFIEYRDYKKYCLAHHLGMMELK